MSGPLPRRDARLLLALTVLVLVPGLTLAYVGLRGLAEREEGLRTQHLATATLVRDRLAAELTKREQHLITLAPSIGEPPRRSDTAASVTRWLDTLQQHAAWIERPFLLEGDAAAMGPLRAHWRQDLVDPLAGSRVAAVVSQAEAAEFVENDLDAALRHYREALARAPAGSGTAAFIGTRVGRTLVKLGREREAVDVYRHVASTAGHAVDRHGLPYAVIALVQIADTLAALGRDADKAQAERDLLQYVVDHPWDLADGFGAYLNRALSSPGLADAALLAQGRAQRDDVATLERLQREIVPLMTSSRQPAGPDGDAARIVVERNGQPILAGYRWLGRPGNVPRVLGYLAPRESVSGEMLDDVLGTIDVDRGIVVGLVGAGPASGRSTPSAGAEPLAEVPFLAEAPGWAVAVFDPQGRSISQLVARERWTYGALVVGMLAVMVVGLVMIMRTSRRAAELARLKTEFVANVSHELKTPLALIRMFGETLESGIVPDDGRRQEFAGVIRRESERLTHLINNVLDLGRIDAGTKRYAFVRGDLVDTVREALDAYRPLFDRLGFEVVADLPNHPIDLHMDRDAVVQALVNLFQNVIKYSDQGKYVRVSVVREGEWAHVSVADRGVGIAASEIAHIFEPYYRAASALGSAPAGSGLGLSIVQHAIAAHGGRVEVESAPGAGSTFTLVLPVLGATAAVPSAETAVARAEV